MERIEAWVSDQRAAREEAEERVRLARVGTERAEMRRSTWKGRRIGKAAKKEEKPPQERLLKRFKRALLETFRRGTH